MNGQNNDSKQKQERGKKEILYWSDSQMLRRRKGRKKDEAKKNTQSGPTSICTWPRICSAVHSTGTFFWLQGYKLLICDLWFGYFFLFLFFSPLSFLYFHSCSHPIVISCMDGTGQSPGRGWPCHTPYCPTDVAYIVRCTWCQIGGLSDIHQSSWVAYLQLTSCTWLISRTIISLVIEEGKAKSGVRAEPLVLTFLFRVFIR